MPISALSRRVLALFVLLFVPDFAYSQSTNSVVIWPINPVIASGERATPLRLENPGKRATLMQIRIFGWRQVDGEERFVEQKEVTGTPPIVRIEPGQQQLVRLTRIAPSPPGSEQSYRIIIDEIPLAETPPPADADADADGPGTKAAAAAIQFRMRYSVPLFTYGDGADTSKQAERPALQWRVVKADGGDALEIRNPGASHARVTGVVLKRADGSSAQVEEAHGYVLAGATMRFAIARPIPAQSRLFAQGDGDSPVAMTPWQP